MIVEDQLDRGAGRKGGIEKLEEFDELAAAVAISDERVDLAGEQINAGQQAERAMTLLAGTRSDSRRLIERSGFGVMSQAAIIFSFVIGIAQGTSALGFCQSTSGLDVVSPHCIREPQIEIDLQLVD